MSWYFHSSKGHSHLVAWTKMTNAFFCLCWPLCNWLRIQQTIHVSFSCFCTFLNGLLLRLCKCKKIRYSKLVEICSFYVSSYVFSLSFIFSWHKFCVISNWYDTCTICMVGVTLYSAGYLQSHPPPRFGHHSILW